MSKPIFIGHGRSMVWYQLKQFLSDRLHLPCDEFNAEEVAGTTTTERLQNLLDTADFAFLVMTPEDIHADNTSHARENVIHEAGLFQGRLGFKRAIILLEDGCAQFSNIDGLTTIIFPKANMEPVFEKIRRVLEREGVSPVTSLSEGGQWVLVAEPAEDPASTSFFPDDALQVWSASNLDARDSVVTLTNTNTDSNLCVNVYIFSPVGLIVACGYCRIPPNGLVSYSCRQDLINNTLTSDVPTSIIIKLIASSSPTAVHCNPGSINPSSVASGLRA